MSDKEKIWKLNLNKTESIVINSDEHSEYFREISSHHVKVKLSFKSSHLESTSCMNLTDMVNYNWPVVKSTESLIAVHQSGKYIAYGICIANGKSSIRIHDVDLDLRHRVDELLFPVADLAFVSSVADDNMMLAAVDQKGNVIIYVLYLLGQQFHYERYLEVTASENPPPGPHKLVWCPGDKESDIPRSLAVTRGKKIEIWNIDSIHAKHAQRASTAALPLSSLSDDILEMNQHTDVVTKVCFSLDGAAVASASLDGTIMFFQIIDLDEPGVPKLLHSWEPHGGAPVTHMLMLDNIEEDACWRFLVSFSKDNSVMKLWSTETWSCLQMMSFHGPTPSDSIRIIPYVDRYSKYIYLSDYHNKVFYVLELYSDPTHPIVYVFKFAAFLVISPILSVHVNSCDVVPKPSTTGSGLMLGADDDEEDVDHDYSDLRDRYTEITHLNRIRLYILQPKSLQNCVLAFPNIPVVPDVGRMVLVDNWSDVDIDFESSTPPLLQEPPPPARLVQNMQDACDLNLVNKKLHEFLAAPAPPLPSSSDNNQHLDLMTPDAFTSTTSLHNSPHPVLPPADMLSSLPIVDVSILESKMKSTALNYEDLNSVASSTALYEDTNNDVTGTNYRTVSSNSSPSREVEEIMQPYSTSDIKDKELKVEDKVNWPEALPVAPVQKTEKQSPLAEDHAKKQRTYNGGLMLSEANHISAQDHALETQTILLSLQKIQANIQALNSQVSTTVTLAQQSQQAIELQGVQLKALEQKVERMAGKQQESHVEDHRMNQELLVSQITQAVHNIVSEKLQSVVVNHFNSVVMPKLVQSMNSLKTHINTELSQKLSATDRLLTENLTKIVESKAVLNTVTTAVLQNLQPGMTECFKDYFRRSIAQYERATNTMLKQLSENYDTGMRQIMASYEQNKSQTQECMGQVQQVSESLAQAQRHFQGSLHSLETSLNDSLAKHLSSQKAVLEGVVHSAVQSRTVTPVPNVVTSTVNQMQLKQNQIKAFLHQKQYNAAFQQALSAQNLSLVLYICDNIPPSKLFDMTPCPLEQHVLISLIQQLSGDLDTKTVLKCEYIDEALSALDPTHASTREHGPNILHSTLAKLKSFSVAHREHSALKNVKKLERVIQGVLKDFD